MLTFEAARLLKKLKRVQIKRNNQIFINWNTLTASTFDVPESKGRKLKLDADNDDSLLEELEKAGCIDTKTQVYTICHINSAGWSYGELSARKAFREFIRSVFFPAIVALITSLIVNWLKL